MALIYRVEDIRGLGIYTSGADDWLTKFDDKENHPGPHRDARLKDWFSPGPLGMWYEHKSLSDWDIRFGFASEAQLLKWLYKPIWLKQLAKAGMKLAIYDAPDFRIGETQAVFDARTATLVETHDLTTIKADITAQLELLSMASVC